MLGGTTTNKSSSMKYYNLLKFAILLCLTLLSHYVFGQAPIVTSVYSSAGCFFSGISVVIKGRHFTKATSVKFAGNTADYFVVYNDSTIYSNIGAGGFGEVKVTTPLGTVTFVPVPSISSSSLMSATARAIDTLRGTSFCGASLVTFGGAVPFSFSVLSDTVIIAEIGKGASGNIIVVTPFGADTMPGFVYIPSPYIASFDPLFGGEGSIITIKGKYFTGVTAVEFGGIGAQAFTVVSDSVISATAAKGVTGSIIITNQFGSGSIPWQFTYRPVITSFTPKSGPAGTLVTISGYGFNVKPSNNYVYIGGVQARTLSATPTSLVVETTVGQSNHFLSVTTAHNNLSAYSTDRFVPTFAGGCGINPNLFKEISSFSASKFPIFNAIGDLNGDGKPDAVTANFGGSTISVFQNTSSGNSISFAAKRDYDIGKNYNSQKIVCIGDLNGDGKPDVVSLSQDNLFTNNSCITIFKNLSSADSIVLDTAQNIVTGYYVKPVAASIIDIDGDGRPDIVLDNANASVSIYRNITFNGPITFAQGVRFVSGSGLSSGITINDFNGDGKPDIATVDYTEAVGIIKNMSIPGEILFAPTKKIPTGFSPSGITSGDFDGDSKVDLAVSETGNSTLSVMRNTSLSDTISFANRIAFYIAQTVSTLRDVSAGDLDGDGKIDLVASTNFNGKFYVLKNSSDSGNVSFATALMFEKPFTSGSTIAMGDIDGDGKMDVIRPDHEPGAITVFRNGIGTPVKADICQVNGSVSLFSYTTTNSYQWQLDDGNGFFNISDNSNFNGTTNDTLIIMNVPSSWNSFQLRCIDGSGCSEIYKIRIVNNWIGLSSNQWENPFNWSCKIVPDANTNVIINSGISVLSSNTSIYSILVYPNASLTITTPFNLIITH